MVEPTSTTFEDLAKGCIIGAFCGDAIGALVEFKSSVTEKEAKKALTLPGGGPFDLGRGQVTDDSELALCLGHGLVESKGVLDLNKIAKYYAEWYASNPFDIGITIRAAVSEGYGVQKDHAKHLRHGSQRSYSSQSNGALMRITPLAVWCANLSKDDLIKAVSEESKLTHPNDTAINASVAYVYTIQHLLRNKGDNKGAYQACKDIVKHLGDPELQSWVDDVEKNKLPPGNQKIGWVKIAFCYSMHFLKLNKGYAEAMEEMLREAGDTDTNCCIVGGVLGALHGLGQLPSEIVKQVVGFEPEKDEGVNRPDFLIPSKCLNMLMTEIIKTAPTKLEVIGNETEEERHSRL